MQSTRRHILEILKEKGQATVEEIVASLSARIGHITAVTIRHHLEVLRGEGLVAAPAVRRRTTPGRPQHVYALTDQALDLFPNNYRNLAAELLKQIKTQFPHREANVILEGVADQLAAGLNLGDVPMPARLDTVVHYLTEQGYHAYWETSTQGFVLHTGNCPYHHLTADNEELCAMDLRLVSRLLGVVPRRIGRLVEGGESCAYLIPNKSIVTE